MIWICGETLWPIDCNSNLKVLLLLLLSYFYTLIYCSWSLSITLLYRCLDISCNFFPFCLESSTSGHKRKGKILKDAFPQQILFASLVMKLNLIPLSLHYYLHYMARNLNSQLFGYSDIIIFSLTTCRQQSLLRGKTVRVWDGLTGVSTSTFYEG